MGLTVARRPRWLRRGRDASSLTRARPQQWAERLSRSDYQASGARQRWLRPRRGHIRVTTKTEAAKQNPILRLARPSEARAGLQRPRLPPGGQRDYTLQRKRNATGLLPDQPRGPCPRVNPPGLNSHEPGCRLVKASRWQRSHRRTGLVNRHWCFSYGTTLSTAVNLSRERLVHLLSFEAPAVTQRLRTFRSSQRTLPSSSPPAVTRLSSAVLGSGMRATRKPRLGSSTDGKKPSRTEDSDACARPWSELNRDLPRDKRGQSYSAKMRRVRRLRRPEKKFRCGFAEDTVSAYLPAQWADAGPTSLASRY